MGGEDLKLSSDVALEANKVEILTRRQRTDERIDLLGRLGRRRDEILENPNLDLMALSELAQEYEEAGLIYAAADLRMRVERYRCIEGEHSG